MADFELTNCDIEPIHLAGAILPHGAMLVLEAATLEILQAAGDTDSLLGKPIGALLGRGVGTCLNAAQVARLQVLSAPGAMVQPRHMLDPLLRVVPDRPADASVHRSGAMLVIEWEPADLRNPHAADPLSTVQAMLESVNRADTVDSFCDAAAGAIRHVTGYDRVMVYRFLEDDSGWVVAESRADHLTPLLDQHYPASDIPKQARALYAKNWLRLIADVDCPPSPLVPAINPRTAQPLDMSFATLRDVSPVHREYLHNMGVAASMSISIMRGDRLWGLIACHHSTPHRLPRHLRAICELFGSMFSLQLEVRDRADSLDARLASRRTLNALMHEFARENDYGEALLKQADRLIQYMNPARSGGGPAGATGLAIIVDSRTAVFGPTPPAEMIVALTEWLGRRENAEEVFMTDRLGDVWPAAKGHADVAAGVLAISISRDPRDFILWFRPEIAATVTWGGNPNKPVEAGPLGDRLRPRKSFEAWKEAVYGRSAPWSPQDAEAGFDLRIALLDIVLRRIDSAAREQARSREREQLLMAELDHRVKNSLAVVQALVTQSGRKAHSLHEYMTSLEQRIRSMARAHSLLTLSRWQGVSLRTVVQEEVDQYCQLGATVTLTGADVTIDPKVALALALAVHELGTNAAKYGALSVATGRVLVTWSRDANGDLAIRWIESGGPRVQPPARRGFGTTLIERALAMDTGGSALTRFEPNGVRCDIVLPGSALADFAEAGESPAEPDDLDTLTAETEPVTMPRILVVEDAALIIMLIEQVIEDLGWTIVGPATRVGTAVALAKQEMIDAAILDINLHGELSWDVAAALQARGIPFVFSTGYDSKAVLPPHLSDHPVICKPFRMDELERRLRELISVSQVAAAPDEVAG